MRQVLARDERGYTFHALESGRTLAVLRRGIRTCAAARAVHGVCRAAIEPLRLHARKDGLLAAWQRAARRAAVGLPIGTAHAPLK